MALLHRNEDVNFCLNVHSLLVLPFSTQQRKCAKRLVYPDTVLLQRSLHVDLKPNLLHILLMVDFSSPDPDDAPAEVLFPHLDMRDPVNIVFCILFGLLAQKCYCTAFPYQACNINLRELRIYFEPLRRPEPKLPDSEADSFHNYAL